MGLAITVIVIIAFVCAVTMSVLSFMVGRCAGKLPIDGALPRVVTSFRFDTERDRPLRDPDPADPGSPQAS